jgi:hypothetical protein
MDSRGAGLSAGPLVASRTNEAAMRMIATARTAVEVPCSRGDNAQRGLANQSKLSPSREWTGENILSVANSSRDLLPCSGGDARNLVFFNFRRLDWSGIGLALWVHEEQQ